MLLEFRCAAFSFLSTIETEGLFIFNYFVGYSCMLF